MVLDQVLYEARQRECGKCGRGQDGSAPGAGGGGGRARRDQKTHLNSLEVAVTGGDPDVLDLRGARGHPGSVKGSRGGGGGGMGQVLPKEALPLSNGWAASATAARCSAEPAPGAPAQDELPTTSLSLSSPPLFLSHRSRPAQLEALTLSRLSVAPSFTFSHSALKQPPPSATLPVSSPARPLSPPWVRLRGSCQHRRPHRLTPPLPIRPQVFPRCGSSN